jgi:hypothetical protein
MPFVSSRSLALSLTMAVLITGVLMQIRVAVSAPPSASCFPNLAVTIPAVVTSWSSEDIPLGETERLAAEARDTLQFDSFVFREYRRGSRSFCVYAAIWMAQKKRRWEIDVHTPDACWPANGWICDGGSNGTTLAAADVRLVSGSSRVFRRPGGGRTNVIFWHFAGGIPVSTPHLPSIFESGQEWINSGFRQFVIGPEEQVFIRISSPEPLEGLSNDPGFQAVVRRLWLVAQHGRSGD